MKLLYLNSVVQIPNEKGEQKIKKALNGVPKDENGMSAKWYEDMGIKPPKNLEESPEIDENGMIFLQEEEFDYDFVDCILRLDDFSSCVDNEKIGSILYTRDGDEMWIEQTSEEIYAYITVLTRHWSTIIADNIIYYFNFFRP
jgi:hypothetical protein